MIIKHILILWEGRCVCMYTHAHKTTLDIKVRDKGKFTQEHAMKAQRGSRDIDLLFL
jgi:hypothetical protein